MTREEGQAQAWMIEQYTRAVARYIVRQTIEQIQLKLLDMELEEICEAIAQPLPDPWPDPRAEKKPEKFVPSCMTLEYVFDLFSEQVGDDQLDRAIKRANEEQEARRRAGVPNYTSGPAKRVSVTNVDRTASQRHDVDRTASQAKAAD